MPKSFSTLMVRSIYGVLSRLPVTIILHSCPVTGSAISSPDMNCDDTPPSMVYVPPGSRPLQSRGRVPLALNSTPCATISSCKGDSGRSGSLPSPLNSQYAPSAAATGSIKRRVEPLSPQFSLCRVLPILLLQSG